jgi:predicted HTH transcriptional regulator
LTLAGLLMLGRWPAIHEAAPYYFVDYQERPSECEENDDTRWLDRVVPDGTWSGNLFDFYRRVARKLVTDLKVPFALKGDVRQDDTPVHQALREAMVNMLVHADYADRASVLVVKQPSGFVFRNPGLLRVPAALALQGGESDSRNRTLQQMFLMIGLGERAGSGLTKIQRGWRESGGRLNLADSFEPYDQTRLDMDFSREEPDSARRFGKTSGKTSGKMSGKTSGKVLLLLKEAPELSIPEMATRLGKSERTIERATHELRSTGKLTRIGPDKGGHWKVMDGK